jgi:hypothetical protein
MRIHLQTGTKCEEDKLSRECMCIWQQRETQSEQGKPLSCDCSVRQGHILNMVSYQVGI